jgi:hypothetical protein
MANYRPLIVALFLLPVLSASQPVPSTARPSVAVDTAETTSVTTVRNGVLLTRSLR